MYLTPSDDATGKLRFVMCNGSITQYLDGTAALPTNTWTHIAVTLSGNTGVLYVNGTAVDTDTAMTINPDQLHAPSYADWNFIGRGNSGNYFSGRIDDFKIRTKGISAADVNASKAVTAGTAPAADVTAPTPTTASWLVEPKVVGDNSITMSATEGTDAGGNGVLYSFECLQDSTHNSGWISENTYTDNMCLPGTTYTYTVRMKDRRGNIGTSSVSRSATTPAVDTTSPTPNPPTFAQQPKGISSTAITMTATKGVDSDGLVLYKFNRIIPMMNTVLATSGWISSPTWTDTRLTPDNSYIYNLQMKDSHGNLTSVTVSNTAVARDYTPPVLDADFRLQWNVYPYTQLDKTIRMCATQQAETNVEYYYECVADTAINSGWTTNRMWVTPPMADGTHQFHFKIRDNSPQKNESGWSAVKTAKVLPTNSWHDYSLSQLASLPDSTLVSFTGKVTAVNADHYIVSTFDNSSSIRVVPRTFGYQTDYSKLNQIVDVKGHLWTYTGTPKRVTGAIVAGNPQTGRIEFENCDYDDDLARPLYDAAASGCEYLGWHQSGWSITVNNVAASTQISMAYSGTAGKISMYLNGAHYRDISYPTADGWGTVTVSSINIPAGASLRFQQDAGDSAPKLDYLVVGAAYAISGKVTNSSGAAVPGTTVQFSSAPNAHLNPVFVLTTDAAGNYSKVVPTGTWYVVASADALAYYRSSESSVTVNNAAVANVNFTLQPIAREFPRSNDLLFACVTDMLPDAGLVSSWSSYIPLGLKFTSSWGAPEVEYVGSQKWVRNVAGFSTPEYQSAIPVNGATIVGVVRPNRNTDNQAWPATFTAFFDRVTLGIENKSGRIMVRRNGSLDWYSNTVPDAQTSVISLVVQPTGQYKVYLNGTQVINNTNTSDMTSLVPGVPGPYAKTLTIGSNGPDGWSAFNGLIGDVAFYKVALSDAERIQLETTLSNKFSGQLFSITASAGEGGTISPEIASVVEGSNKTFTITPNIGYVINQILVDGQPQGAINTYTFTNVSANHTISATFTAMPNNTITATAGPNGSITPSGSVAVTYNGNQTFDISPNAGYAVDQVIVDGIDQGATASYTFTNVTANHSISVTFKVYAGPTPVAFYEFENNVQDARGTYNGTAFNNPTYVQGKIGRAIQFNGTNQYVSIPRAVSGNFSITFWMKTTQSSPSATQWYNGKGVVDGECTGATNDFGISHAGNKIAFGVGNTDKTYFSTSSINNGEWIHVACTRNSSTGQMKIYINGVLERTATGATGTKAAPANLNIGRILTDKNYFNGAIDQLRFFNSVLTAGDVTMLAAENNARTITASAGPNGSISPSGTISINSGESAAFTIIPNTGYGIAGLMIDNQPIIPTVDYLFTNVTSDHSIAAAFAKPVGVNSKSLLTDTKLQGRLIKAWGKVMSANGSTSFTIDDGYGSPITVSVNGAPLPSGLTAGKMAVVTGILDEDKTLHAQNIISY